MPRVLHILTRPDDPLAQDVIQRQQGDVEIQVVDLTGPNPDYNDLLTKVFEAESVECW